MKQFLKWSVIALFFAVIIGLIQTRTPDQVTERLTYVAGQTGTFSLAMHLAFPLLILLGLANARLRTRVFTVLLAGISLSAAVVSALYGLAPNVLAFGLVLLLVLNAALKKELTFAPLDSGWINFLFGFAGLAAGLWYPHWVPEPVWMNAFLVSPLGVLNCPTLLAFCGLLCWSVGRRSAFLEGTVSLFAVYYGFYGVFRLGVAFDSLLAALGLFLFFRLGSSLPAGSLNPSERATSGQP